jgi:uncharacterized membrane-anchored protein YitT (DUF2179 family)
MQRLIRHYFFIILGSFLIAYGVVSFLVGNDITTGGSPGFALLLYHLVGFSIGSMILAYNIPLLLIGWRFLGKQFAFRTILTIFLISFFTDFLNEYLHVKSIVDDLMLASIFGGVIIGIGVGFLFRANSSAGGSTLIAKILNTFFEVKPSLVIFFVDMCIIVTSMFVFLDVQNALWSIICIYITSKAVDATLSGGVKQKVVHITSDKVEIICKEITSKLRKEGSILQGRDLFYTKEKNIIFIIVPLSKLRLLRHIIQQNDSSAVMVVMDATELLGR